MSSDAATEILKQDGVTVIVFGISYNNLETEFLQQLTDLVGNAAQTADPPLIVADLTQTKFFGSDFLSVLLHGWKQIKDGDGAKMVVCGLTPFATRIFDATQLDKVWDTYESRDEAVQALRNNVD